jgi:hypothetical protein
MDKAATRMPSPNVSRRAQVLATAIAKANSAWLTVVSITALMTFPVSIAASVAVAVTICVIADESTVANGVFR